VGPFFDWLTLFDANLLRSTPRVTFGTEWSASVDRLVDARDLAYIDTDVERDTQRAKIMHVDRITNSTMYLQEQKYQRENPGDCVAISNLIRQLNWQELAGLLEK
jgi:hypothetical protein